MILAVTGHRPEKIGGYKIPNPTYSYVWDMLNDRLGAFNPELVITGMALGFDQMVANACALRGIPFLAAIPFVGQESRWPRESQMAYKNLLSHASGTVVVSEGGYDPKKMHIRNEFMVDNADLLLACWDGSDEGGTYRCVQYAKKVGINFVRINPLDAP